MKIIVTGQDQRVADFVSKGIGCSSFSNFSTVGLESDGELIAGVVYAEFNGRSITCHIYGIGKTWLNREFLWFIFHYPFVQLNVCRITVIIESSNRVSINFVEKLGFIQEATLLKAGSSGDLHIYRMFREECKWLKVSKNGFISRSKACCTAAYS